jgi:hypothetical protein
MLSISNAQNLRPDRDNLDYIPSHRKFASRRRVAQKRSVLMVHEHSSNIGLTAKS